MCESGICETARDGMASVSCAWHSSCKNALATKGRNNTVSAMIRDRPAVAIRSFMCMPHAREGPQPLPLRHCGKASQLRAQRGRNPFYGPQDLQVPPWALYQYVLAHHTANNREARPVLGPLLRSSPPP